MFDSLKQACNGWLGQYTILWMEMTGITFEKNVI